MAILERVSQLVVANINDLLDRAEDPEKMLNQLLRDMESQLRLAREQVMEMIGQQKLLESHVAQYERRSRELTARARRQVDAKRDDLARESLLRKRDAIAMVAIYESQLETQQESVTVLKHQLGALERKYRTTLGQRDMLIARERRARAQIAVARSLAQWEPFDPTLELERMERRIMASEARGAALSEMATMSLDAQMSELEDDLDIESELALLKGDSIPALGEPSRHENVREGPEENAE
jgi:phage shock protein A